ncbi:hypothetical protein EDB80DRAFT_814366, partial [Ilyonectria destructans]
SFSASLGPPIASVAADVSPWLPFIISYILLLSTFPLLAIMPKDPTVSEPRPPISEQTGDVHTPPEHRSVRRTVLHASLLLAFATNSGFLVAATMIYCLGFGARSTLLSLITSRIDPERAGTLDSAVFLVEQIGMLGGGPLVHNLLGVGFGLQDP